MIVVRSPTETTAIDDQEIKALVDLRFTQIWIGEQYNAEQHGYMVVVEPQDTTDLIEQETGCPILTNPYQETRFGDPDFSPLCETLEEHHGKNGTICYEMLFILNDDGFGITVFIPKKEGVSGDLLALCAQFATPAQMTS